MAQTLSVPKPVTVYTALDGIDYPNSQAADYASVLFLVASVPAPSGTGTQQLANWIIENKEGLTYLINLINTETNP